MSTMPAKQFTVRDPDYVERVKDAFSRQLLQCRQRY